MKKAVYSQLVLDQPVKVYVDEHVLRSIGITDAINDCEGVITGFYPSGWVQIRVMGNLYDIWPNYLLTK